MLDLTRSETDKPKERFQDVDHLEGQGTRGTQGLPPLKLIGYFDEAEDSTSVLLKLT